MFRACRLLLLCACASCEPTQVIGYGEARPDGRAPAVYETFELTFEAPEIDGNRFTRYATVTFTHAGERFQVDGFYDGQDRWVARFMPNQPGTWRYEWSLGAQRGSGEFRVVARLSPDRHGHVKPRDGAPHQLAHDDDTPHYWFGGKWFSARNYGPLEKGNEHNDPEDGSGHDSYYDDARFLDYASLLERTRHTGSLLKLGMFPLEDNGTSWDLGWIRRADEWVAELDRLGVYVQINLFDPWSRQRGSPLHSSTNPEEHVLNAWSSDDTEKKENYIRYAVARFAGYSNVYWELANRVDEPGEALGDTFVEQANEHYMPWLRQYDPYRLAVGVSDVARARQIRDSDIEIPRDTLSPPEPDSRRATIHNELVHPCSGSSGGSAPQPAHEDSAIRNPENRLCYRASFWRAFVMGAFGSAEASWLDLTKPIDDAVHDVMLDKELLRATLEQLRVPVDELVPNAGFAEVATGHVGTRAKNGELYVSYFLFRHSAGTIWVRLNETESRYQYRWLDPAHDGDTGLPSGEFVATEGLIEIARPGFENDLVLVVQRM